MFIQKLKLQNFRCFADKTFLFEKPFVLIEGNNGSGKTSILEALHYGCFLKSFRTSRAKDLLSFDKNHFFLQVLFEENAGDQNQVQIGLSFESQKRKQKVQFNKKQIKSYKELISHYRIISLSEDDLQLVQGSPDIRRYFLNQLIVLFNPDFVQSLKQYKQIVEHRNSLLTKQYNHNLKENNEFKTWSQQLWNHSKTIQKERIKQLKELENIINDLLKGYFEALQLTISFKYNAKGCLADENFDNFWKKHLERSYQTELRWQRSLFGAHLDDFSIIFQKKKARYFASRGQQKLVLFLIKIALAQQLAIHGLQATLLLDDFLTDLDQNRFSDCLKLLANLDIQVFVTCPLKSLIFSDFKNTSDVQTITLE